MTFRHNEKCDHHGFWAPKLLIPKQPSVKPCQSQSCSGFLCHEWVKSGTCLYNSLSWYPVQFDMLFVDSLTKAANEESNVIRKAVPSVSAPAFNTIIWEQHPQPYVLHSFTEESRHLSELYSDGKSLLINIGPIDDYFFIIMCFQTRFRSDSTVHLC